MTDGRNQLSRDAWKHVGILIGLNLGLFLILDAAIVGLFRVPAPRGHQMAAVCFLTALMSVIWSSWRERWPVADQPLLASLRSAWTALMCAFAAASGLVAYALIGDGWLAGAVSAAVLWTAFLCGWPRLRMPVTDPPPWWSIKRYLSLVRIASIFALISAAVGLGGAVYVHDRYAEDLPSSLTALTDYEPMRATRVLSAEGQVIGEFFIEKRIIVPYAAIPKKVRDAFVAAEDRRFFEHHGIDPLGIIRAAAANVKAKRVVQGGSTITQQVAKQLLTGNERNFERKIKEALLARRIERELSKDAILGIYLNHVYLGHGAYGVEVASEIYFAKSVADLTLGEAAMLAGLMTAPSRHSPFDHFDQARARQKYVLDRMAESGLITEDEAESAAGEQIAVVSTETPVSAYAAPYFVEQIRKDLSKKYGGKGLFLHGLTVQTTLSLKHQRLAEAALRRGLDDLDLSLGFRGPLDHLEGDKADKFRHSPPSPYLSGRENAPVVLDAQPGRAYYAMVSSRERGGIKVIIGKDEFTLATDDMKRVASWEGSSGAKLKSGDVVAVRLRSVAVGSKKSLQAFLTQQPRLQAAFIAIDPQDGKLLAMVGGYDYGINQFNRAVQAKRQAGSSIKPLVYAAAIQAGLSETDVILDAPYSKKTASGVWEVENYDKTYAGPVTLRTAIAKSLNTVSCRLVDKIGVDRVIAMMRRLGIESDIPRNTTIAVGTPDVRLIEMVYAYATFPSGGREITPRYIDKIVDASGKVLVDRTREAAVKQRLDPETAYLMVDLMKGVVENGTARRARSLGRPAAGKTGTSTDFRDAWFIGFTADLLAGVWIGRDDFTPIGDKMTGGSAALPIWLEYMRRAHPATPPRDFQVPPGIVFLRGDPRTGKSAPGFGGDTALIPYRRGSLPAAVSATLAKSVPAETF